MFLFSTEAVTKSYLHNDYVAADTERKCQMKRLARKYIVFKMESDYSSKFTSGNAVL